MSRETVLLDRTTPGYHDLLILLLTHATIVVRCSCHDGRDLLRLVHNLLRHSAFDGVTCDDDAIPGVWSPSLEKLARCAGLHHTRRSQHDGRAHVVEAFQILQRTHETEIPGSSPTYIALSFGFSEPLLGQALYVIVHSSDIGLVNLHTAAG